jgi:predicted TIM-barrel fold metal-dependent hydrolase
VKVLSPLLRQADLSNVGVKVSAFYACNAFPHVGVAPVVEAIAAAFGPKRLYWGSDFVPALDDVSFAQTIEAAKANLGRGISKSAVFHDNLNRILKGVR